MPKQPNQIVNTANLNQGGTYILDINGKLVSAVLFQPNNTDPDAFIFADNKHHIYRVYVENDGSFIVYRDTEWDHTAVKIFEEVSEENMLKGGTRRRRRRRTRRRQSVVTRPHRSLKSIALK
jgi:hypothetical protein